MEMARQARARRFPVFTVCLGSAAVFELALGAPYTEPMLVVGAFFLGIVAQSSKICVDTLVQSSIDDEYRGR